MDEVRFIREGVAYRHFKGGMYLVIALVNHTETGERLVVYRSLGDGLAYARPYEMFASEVDREKYPSVKQKYRFEEIDWSDLKMGGK